MRRLLAFALVVPGAMTATADAAAPPGSYAGTSSGKYVQVGQATEPTDKGKVTFKVAGDQVKDFRLRGQLLQCGPPAELPLTVKTIKLNASGKGSTIHKDPTVGALKVSITVSSKGRASGTISRPRSATGLCDPEYPVRFTARRR